MEVVAALLETPDRVDRLAAFEDVLVAARGLRVVDIERRAANTFRGKLAVECRAVDRRLAVVRFGVSRCAGLGGAAKPVIGARQRDRAIRDLGDAGEVPRSGLRIVQSAKSVPAGVEFGIGQR